MDPMDPGNKFRFSEARLNALPVPEKRRFYYDEQSPGLELAVTPNGTKSFHTKRWCKQLNRSVRVLNLPPFH